MQANVLPPLEYKVISAVCYQVGLDQGSKYIWGNKQMIQREKEVGSKGKEFGMSLGPSPVERV